MSLIDMLTDIKSFNYNKVGKKHGEYFGEDNATGFTTDRNTKDPTEFVEGSGNDFNFKNKVGYSRFEDTNQTGFTIDRVREGGTGLGNTEYIIGSGNDFNFVEKVGYSRFLDTNQTGFTIDRNTKDPTEYIIGSGNEFNFTNSGQNFGGHIFFSDIHATGFTPDKIHKDSSDYVGISDLKFDGKTSLYGDIDSNVLGTDDDYDGIRDASAPKIKSKKDLVLNNVDYAKVSDAKGDVEPAINKGKTVPKKSKEYVSKVPNKPQTPMFSEDHPYGALPSKKEFEDESGEPYDAPYEITEEYVRFGGNDGLRPGYPSNANQGVFGSDSPYVIKEIGDKYDTLEFAVDSAITILPFKIVRTVEDVIRIGKWNLTARGLMWNANQFLLTAQNARGENRLFNPLGSLGSLVPYVHLPRHTDGTFTDFKEPPSYPVSKPQDQDIVVEEKNFLQKGVDRLNKALGVQNKNENKLDELRKLRIEIGGEEGASKDDPGPLSALGLFQTAFTDPKHQHQSMKGPFGGDLKENGQLITTYSDLKTFGDKKQGQSNIRLSHGETPEVDIINDGYSTNVNVSVERNSFASSKETKQDASKYNLGRGQVKSRGGLYSVGVSNQLQVPYGGQFNRLRDSVEELPKDFINFRIRDAVNGKWLIFPAHLGTLTDTISPEYARESYIGRPDEVHIYTKTSRTVGFDFKVAAFTKQEIPIIQEKMNYLIGLGYPTYKKHIQNDETVRPVTPYIYLTIGDLFNNTPGYFDNISVTFEETAVWEIDEGLQIPHYFNVSVNFVYIGKHLPHTLGKHYDVPFLTDTGVGANKFGTFDTDPRDGTTIRPNVNAETAKWSSGLPKQA